MTGDHVQLFFTYSQNHNNYFHQKMRNKTFKYLFGWAFKCLFGWTSLAVWWRLIICLACNHMYLSGLSLFEHKQISNEKWRLFNISREVRTATQRIIA